MADDNDPDMTAAELVLGLLEGEELAAALRRKLSDPGFAQSVMFWEERFAPLLAEISEAEPPATVWTGIHAAIDQGQTVAPLLLRKVRIWRSAAIAASAVAASLALLLVLRPVELPLPQATSHLIAQLGPSETAAMLLASYEERSAELTIAPATIQTSGHSPELWIIPTGQKPRSLGLIKAVGTTRIVIPAKLRAEMHSGGTLAVSLEPRGGSPTGQPTGPVVATGKLTKI